MVLFKLAERSLGLISTVILARLLVPADFGLVAMAMSVIAVIEVASAFSFEIPLIQREHVAREHYDTAWTLGIALGTGCALVTAGLAYPAALLYDEPRLAPIMLVLAGSWLVLSFENIGVVNFRRNMDFAREFRFLTAKKLVAFVVTVTLALLLQSYWALVAGTVVGRIAGVVLSYTMQPFRPRISLAASRDLFSFSGWLFVNNILSVILARTSHFIIGRAHGPEALGLYTVGTEIAYLPATELIAPINRAVLPGYSRMAPDPHTLGQGFTSVMSVILAVALPASVGVAVIAEPLVKLLLGDNWLGAVPLIRILAFCGVIYAMMSNNLTAYFAIGKPHLPPFVLAVRLAVLLPLLVILGRPFGVEGVAYAELIASVASLAVSYPVLFRTLKVSSRSYLASLWRPLIAAAVMGFAVHALLGALAAGPGAFGAALQLSTGTACGVVVYFVALWGLWVASGKPHGAEAYLLEHASRIHGSSQGSLATGRPPGLNRSPGACFATRQLSLWERPHVSRRAALPRSSNCLSPAPVCR